MSDQATATVAPEATAIEPERVLILSDDDQLLLLDLLQSSVDRAEIDANIEGRVVPPEIAAQWRLLYRIAYGDEFNDEFDELTRVTLRKRRLETEIGRANRRIADLEEPVVDDLLARGQSGAKHDATGAQLVMQRKVWVKVRRAGDKPTPEEKAAAAEALQRAAAAGVIPDSFVKPDFNTNTVSAFFREQVTEHDEAQRELPEHQRVARPVESFLPDALKPFFELTDKPTISIRAAQA